MKDELGKLYPLLTSTIKRIKHALLCIQNPSSSVLIYNPHIFEDAILEMGKLVFTLEAK